jgi:hypothetical protein
VEPDQKKNLISMRCNTFFIPSNDRIDLPLSFWLGFGFHISLNKYYIGGEIGRP